MNKFYDFNVTEITDIKQVGGKANSLINLTKGGFNVPGGAVLTVEFFADWIKELCSDESLEGMWKNPKKFKELGEILKTKAKEMIYSEEQKSIVFAILEEHKKSKLFAVRSSSPEEDLTGASFAGGYETILGVKEDTILEAVKVAFISCMNERVFFYKYQNGFDTSVLRIAVIIQEQIPSDISGVGFSLNPLNNSYDEAVIDANSGLGESVVSGMITPDEYVVDKNSGEILSKILGSKEKAIILLEDGGTEVVEGEKDKFVLEDIQVSNLTELLTKIEDYYGFPVDIEWTFYNDELYLLQSRPITAFIPLPEEMKTKPGENKILYLDGSLTKQGITTPISVLGCDCIGLTQAIMFKDMMGKDVTADIKGGLATTRGGRMYINASTTMKFQSQKRMVSMWKTVDVITAQMLETLDMSPYIPGKLPESMKGVMFGTIKNNLGSIKYTKKASKDPKKYKEWYQPFEDEFDNYLKEVKNSKMNLKEAPEEILTRYIHLLNKMLPMTYAAELARKNIRKQLDNLFEDGADRMQYLERSLPDNVTIDMGMKMFELSQIDDIKNNKLREFLIRVKRGECSEKFKKEWDEYISLFGCRTSNELDVGVKRSSESISELFKQIKSMSLIDEDFSPVAIYNRSKKQREETFNELIEKLSASKANKLEGKYNVLVELGGKREALKYWYVRSLAAIRELIEIKAAELKRNGKLDNTQDIYWLNYDKVCVIDDLSKEEIYLEMEENKKYYNYLNQVHEFPKLIDSRGEILKMPRAEAKEGEVVGQPISPGTVVGRVKVLNTPDEKPLLPGEIMVARATDPGWTPLFINASAILLEVGGLLQHGALVAREYGKPCIAGIEDAMNRFADGQLIEVNASTGVIKILGEDYEESN